MFHFAIIGFPKCGTSALTLMLAAIDGVTMHTPGEHSTELPLFRRSIPTDLPPTDGRLHGHKFSAYIYKPDALRRLREHNPDILLVLCVRHPARSLVSWHRKHQIIAAGEVPHVVNRTPDDRRFYMTADVDAYYERRQGMLRYSEHIPNLEGMRALAVRQESLAADSSTVLNAIGVELGFAAPVRTQESVHKGYADEIEFPGSSKLLRCLEAEAENCEAAIKRIGVKIV